MDFTDLRPYPQRCRHGCAVARRPLDAATPPTATSRPTRAWWWAGSGAYLRDAQAARFLMACQVCGARAWAMAASEIAKAIAKAALELDYAPAFQFGHPLSFALANNMKQLTPAGLDYVFFTGSGSESADTAPQDGPRLLARQGAGGKTRLIGREKGYHGVNFGGISGGRHCRQPQALWSGH